MHTSFVPALVAASMLLLGRPSVAAPPGESASEAGVTEAARLARERDEATAGGELQRALLLAERATELAGAAHVEALYRLARVHALLGHRKEACGALERASEAGIVDARALRRDPAFVPLREDERFRKLAKAIDVRQYVAALERTERVAFQKPDEVLKALALRPGEKVADVGAGSGYFTVRLARVVGPAGHVLAVDVDADLLAFVERRVAAEGLSNVTTVRAEKDDPRLPRAGVDTILMVDTLHLLKRRDEYARRLLEALAPGGRVVVIDYRPEPPRESPWGPWPEAISPGALRRGSRGTRRTSPRPRQGSRRP